MPGTNAVIRALLPSCHLRRELKIHQKLFLRADRFTPLTQGQWCGKRYVITILFKDKHLSVLVSVMGAFHCMLYVWQVGTHVNYYMLSTDSAIQYSPVLCGRSQGFCQDNETKQAQPIMMCARYFVTQNIEESVQPLAYFCRQAKNINFWVTLYSHRLTMIMDWKYRHTPFSVGCNYSPVPSLQLWASYQIRKIVGCACAGNVGDVFPATGG